jgi:hypothetical protein
MRHFIAALAIATHPFGMRKAATTTELIALASLAQAGAARGL